MLELTVLFAVFLVPQYFSLWVTESRALVGFGLVNWLLAAAVGTALAQWAGGTAIRSRATAPFPIYRSMLLLFVLPYAVSHLLPFERIEEIPVELAYRDGGFSSVGTWYVSHLGMSLLATVGLASAIALAVRKGLPVHRMLVVAALPLWPIVAHAVIATVTSGLSMTNLTSEENRSFLQDSTDFGLHGNAFGQYALFAYILFIGAAEGTKGTVKTFFRATAILATVGIVVSFSRTAWGAWILVTTLWNARSGSNRRWLV